MANVDHREGASVCAPPPTIEASRAPFGSGQGGYQIGSPGHCSIGDDRDRSGPVQRFITAKLEVIRTELTLHIQHVPRLVGHVDPSFQD